MGKVLVFITIFASVMLLACGAMSEPVPRESTDLGKSTTSANSVTSGQGTAGGFSVEGPAGEPGSQGPAGPAGPEGAFDFGEADGMDFSAAATPAPVPTAAPGQVPSPAMEDSGTAPSQIETAQRKVISTASISIQVDTVPDAVNQVRTIAESLGGFVEQLSSYGGSNQQQASLTIRVPQDQFFPALERLEGLGEVQNRNVGSQDVSEQYIDLQARLKSAQREEESLLSLLDKAQQVSEILTIERELTRVRSEIERLQGQLNFLERRVDLATISVSLFPPPEEVAQPPSGSLTIELSDVSSRVNDIKNLVSTLGGEVDRVSLSSRDGRERADITFRVFPKDFGQAIEFLEGTGKVRSKDLREGTGDASSAEQPEKPNASIGVSLVQPEPSDTGLIIAIGAPVGGVILVIVLAAAFYFTYRAGRRRRDRFAQ